MNPITFLLQEPITLGVMLLLAAIHRICTPREPGLNELLAKSRAALGHLSLTVIALVLVLLNFWTS